MLYIRGGRIIDPASGLDATGDVVVVDGMIREVSMKPGSPSRKCRVIDAEGCIIAPGLIDLHVHLREPGHTHKETIATGCAAAVAGGFTTICCMPNTQPPLDSVGTINQIRERSGAAGLARVFAVAAATEGRKGERVGSLAALSEAGAVAFSDDGECIMNAKVMRDVLMMCAEVNRPFMQHCQDHDLAPRDASMNAGMLATRLGLVGWPAIAEEIIIERDIHLNRAIGARYHVQHMSSGDSAELVRTARNAGQSVTAEASPHHLLLTEDACSGFDTNAKMNPPLRTPRDVQALRQAVADGVITILATDHAPHTSDEKGRDFVTAPFGIIGLECALPLYCQALIDSGAIDWTRLIALMTIEPARLLRLDALGIGNLEAGGPADITVIDPDLEWTVDASQFKSLSRNCPFDGWTVRSKAIATIVAGKIVAEDARVAAR